MEIGLISALAFFLSFIFALGGVGSAIVLIPVLNWLGIPMTEAKPTGLFVNTASMVSATASNIRHKRLDFSLGLPIIISSVVIAPVGAYLSTLFPERIILILFVLFLFFSGNMMLFFKGSKYKEQYREDRPFMPLLGIGVLAGALSGMLGVGGGGVISPLLLVLGFNPKKIAAVTAFAVPFSSFTGFLAYWGMGHFRPELVLPVGLAACAGGYIGTHFMQNRLSPATVKKLLALLILGLGIKLLFQVV